MKAGLVMAVIALGAVARGAWANATIFTDSGTACSPAACLEAGQFGILTYANAIFQTNNDHLNGLVGFGTFGSNGKLQATGPATDSGPFDFSDALNASSGGYMVPNGSSIGNTTIRGGTAYNPSLVSAALMQVTNISAYWAVQPGTTLQANLGKGNNTLGAIGGGVQVFNANYNINANQDITIQGGPNDLVIVNVPAGYSVQLGANISLTGGITSDQVLFNILGGTNNVLQTSGANKQIFADFLVRTSNYQIDAVDIHGRVLGGTGQLAFVSGGSLDAPPDATTATPEPSTWFSMAAGLGLIGAASMLQRFRRA